MKIRRKAPSATEASSSFLYCAREWLRVDYPGPCPGWVIRVGLTEQRRLPVYPGEQTFLVWADMSQKCQQATSDPSSLPTEAI